MEAFADADEDLGVPIKRNSIRAFLAPKSNPMTYGQMAINPYVYCAFLCSFAKVQRIARVLIEN